MSRRRIKLYLAGPLFTTAERAFNSALEVQCREQGFEVWLPQDHEPREQTAKAIFLEDVKGIDWADIVVANMDGPDPDSGTCWEVGYAYAQKKPIFCFRTDMRGIDDFAGSPYNLMLSQSASVVIDMKLQSPFDIAKAIYHNAYYSPGVVTSNPLTVPKDLVMTPRYRHSDK